MFEGHSCPTEQGMTIAVRPRFRAFTLTEVLVIGVVLALVLAVILPALLPARRRESRIGCVNNLKQVGLTFRIWAGDNSDKFPMQVSDTNGGTLEFVPTGRVFPHFLVMSNELNTPKILVCPQDRQRLAAWSFGTNLNDTQISYFVGVDAVQTRPAMLLAGDRNLTLSGTALQNGLVSLATNSAVGWTKQTHKGFGNVVMVDGSVRQTDAVQLQKQLQDSGVSNRLAIP